MKGLPELISEWKTALEKVAGEAFAPESLGAHFESLAQLVESLRDTFFALGDQARHNLKNASQDTDPSLLSAYVATYVWPEQSKNFMVLLRNVLFEQHKAHLLFLENEVTEESLAELRERSREKVAEMAAELVAALDSEVSDMEKEPKAALRSMRTWRLQKNPWPLYREQIAQVPKQCRDLLVQHESWLEAMGHLAGIRKSVEDMVQNARSEIGALREIAGHALRAIEEEGEKGESGRPAVLAGRLEQEEMQVQLVPHLGNYQTHAEFRLGQLPERISFPVEARAGTLVVHELNLRRRTEQWLESSILPLLYEIWEITESESNGMKMAILNVHNRVALISGEDHNKKEDLSKLELGEPVKLFMATIDNSEDEFATLERLVRRRLNRDFRIGPMFRRERSFISVTAPSTFEQFNRNKVLRTLQEWGQKQVVKVRQFIRLVEQEEALSTSEKCVRYIQNRKGIGSDSQYAGIFLTRGYIGESFCVGRDDEIAHFARVVGQWDQGYRGSVCLTGKRLSGKSLFGELVSHRFFPEMTIRLTPGETVRVDGRRVELGLDLEKALTEIRKITLNRRPLIWIDDLELWQDPSIPLNQNMRALRRFLDNYSTDMFFLVSMGNWLRAWLDRFHPLDRLFQAEINLDRMSPSEIREAIWVRHTATNRRLLDVEGRDMSPKQVTRITTRIHRASDGVVGDALNFWSASTLPGEGNAVVNAFKDQFSLPDFITQESGLLLAYMMMQKRSQEYQLRKYFGPAFPDRYAPVLKRLISVGILERQLDHSLEVNKLVVNDLGKLLEYHEYLHYHRWKS